MVAVLQLQVNASEIQDELDEILVRYLMDEISKPELEDQLLRAAGRHACKHALKELRPKIDYVLRCDPLVEPRDYSKARPSPLVAARHCLTADDLRKMGGGRAAAWAAPSGPNCPPHIVARRSEPEVPLGLLPV